MEKCQICHLYHFRCRHIKLILIGPINGPFTPRVSCSNWIHMFRWHQMSSTKKSFSFSSVQRRSKYEYFLWREYDDLYLIWMYKMMDESVRWRSFLLVLVRYGTVTCALDIWSWYAELCYYSIYIMFHTRATLSLNR